MAEPGYTSVPVPDPTVLTTAALYREVGALQALLEQRLEDMQRQIDCRLDDMETLRDAKFAAVEVRFTLLNELREQGRDATRTAVEAALAAQKEAVAKSETSTNKQLDALAETFRTEANALRRSIDDNKERVNQVGSVADAYGQQKQGSVDARQVIGWAIAAVASLVAVAAVIISAVRPG